MPSDALACLLALGVLGCATRSAPLASAPPSATSRPEAEPNRGSSHESKPALAPAAAVLKLEDLDSAHDGKTVTVRVFLKPVMQGCTRSVPANCWGNIGVQSATGGRTPRAELIGSRCSFPASGSSTCTPSIDPTLTYEVTGKVSYSTGLIAIEPTDVAPVP